VNAGTRPRRHVRFPGLTLDRHDRRVAAQTARKRLQLGRQVEPLEDFRELRIRIDLPHPVAVSHGIPLQQCDVSREHDAIGSGRGEIGIITDDDGIEPREP
jgi:hypothetical protein